MREKRREKCAQERNKKKGVKKEEEKERGYCFLYLYSNEKVNDRTIVTRFPFFYRSSFTLLVSFHFLSHNYSKSLSPIYYIGLFSFFADC